MIVEHIKLMTILKWKMRVITISFILIFWHRLSFVDPLVKMTNIYSYVESSVNGHMNVTA